VGRVVTPIRRHPPHLRVCGFRSRGPILSILPHLEVRCLLLAQLLHRVTCSFPPVSRISVIQLLGRQKWYQMGMLRVRILPSLSWAVIVSSVRSCCPSSPIPASPSLLLRPLPAPIAGGLLHPGVLGTRGSITMNILLKGRRRVVGHAHPLHCFLCSCVAVRERNRTPDRLAILQKRPIAGLLYALGRRSTTIPRPGSRCSAFHSLRVCGPASTQSRDALRLSAALWSCENTE
jgi:hypothetical protein